MKIATMRTSSALFHLKICPCSKSLSCWTMRSIDSVRPRQRLDLRGKVVAAVEQQGLHEELALRTRDFALPERARDLHEKPLRVVVGDAGRDELEQQVGRGVGAPVLKIAARGLERELRGTRIPRREIAGRGRLDLDIVGLRCGGALRPSLRSGRRRAW